MAVEAAQAAAAMVKPAGGQPLLAAAEQIPPLAEECSGYQLKLHKATVAHGEFSLARQCERAHCARVWGQRWDAL